MKLSLYRRSDGKIETRDHGRVVEKGLELVTEIDLHNSTKLLTDDPELQNLVRVAFTRGAQWGHVNPDKGVAE